MKTTKKHFETFCNECQRWIEIWGLHGRWAVSYHHREIDGDCAANSAWDADQKRAAIGFNKTWDDDFVWPLDDESIERAAFHEVAHLFLGELHSMAEKRFVGPDDIDAAIHTIIVSLENVVLANTEE